MTQDKCARAVVANLPSHSGDGYGYGGGAIVVFDGTALQFGEGERARTRARFVAAAINAYQSDVKDFEYASPF